MSLWLLLFFVPLLALAQESIELDPVQVSASKKISDFNFSQSTVLPAEELENSSTGLMSSQMNSIPGLNSAQSGGPGSSVSYFIRGTESRHVAFTLDGLKLNDPSNTDRLFDAAFFSSPFLKEIEIHKGPQAVIFGSDAMGGLIEMSTRKGEEAPETRINFNGGSFGTAATSIGQDWQSAQKKHKGTITAYRFHSDGISRLNKKRFKATEEDATDITQLVSSSNHGWNSNLDTDFLFSFLRGKNELDVNGDSSYDQSRNDQYITQQKTNLKLNKTSAVSLRNGFNRHDRLIRSEFGGLRSSQAYVGGLIQNEALYKFDNRSLTFIGGVASEHEELKGLGLDRSFDLHSIFAQGAYKFSSLRFYGGARAENHVRYGSFYTGSGGVAYSLWGQTLYLQYSQGFKAPSLYQLYGPSFSLYKVGNPSLVPEVNHSWEGGWKLKRKIFDGGVTLFQNRLSNLITYSSVQGYTNQSRFVAEGIELTGKIKQRSFHVMSGFTHQDFRKEETPVLRRPLNSFQGGLAIFPTESSEIAFKGRWFSARKDSYKTGETVKLNSYEVFDVGFKYIFSTFDVGLEFMNVLNRSYEEIYGHSVMPRSVFGHVGLRF